MYKKIKYKIKKMRIKSYLKEILETETKNRKISKTNNINRQKKQKNLGFHMMRKKKQILKNNLQIKKRMNILKKKKRKK